MCHYVPSDRQPPVPAAAAAGDSSIIAGSMGRSMPGFTCVSLPADTSTDGSGSGSGSGSGVLAIDTTCSPLFWSRGYFNNPEATRKSYSADGRYYLSGDLVTSRPRRQLLQGHGLSQGDLSDSDRDGDGDRDNECVFTYVSRNDDIIKSSGYRIGPFEVESCIMTHAAVAEVAVLGTPETERAEVSGSVGVI